MRALVLLVVALVGVLHTRAASATATLDAPCVHADTSEGARRVCAMVNWPVPGEKLAAFDADVMARVIDGFAGTRRCREWFRELECRVELPMCIQAGSSPEHYSTQGPCRSECEAFFEQCPGAHGVPNLCEAFPAKSCHTFAAPLPTTTSGEVAKSGDAGRRSVEAARARGGAPPGAGALQGQLHAAGAGAAAAASPLSAGVAGAAAATGAGSPPTGFLVLAGTIVLLVVLGACRMSTGGRKPDQRLD